MIRTVRLPCQTDEAYRILTDPIRLLAWLNVTSATTGVDIFHVFEVIEKRAQPPWQIRGVIVHYEANRQIKVEARDTDHGPKCPLDFTLEADEGGTILTIEWDQAFIAPLVDRFIDPHSTLRLELITRKMRKNPYDLASIDPQESTCGS